MGNTRYPATDSRRRQSCLITMDVMSAVGWLPFIPKGMSRPGKLNNYGDKRSEHIKIVINTFKYHVSCTDGMISVRINLLFYLFWDDGEK